MEICVLFEADEPYQYAKNREGVIVYKGLANDIFESIVGPDQLISRKHIDWHEGLKALKDGTCHVAMMALYSPDRKSYGYYSVPYRYAEDKFYYHKNKPINYQSIDELLNAAENKQIKLGVTKSAVYTNAKINQFIKKHPDLLVYVDDDKELVQLLLDKKIHGYFADQSKMELFLWRSGFHNKVLKSDLFLGKQDIYYLFSKKVVSKDYVNAFNTKLTSFKQTKDYRNIIREYRVPLFIAMTTDTIYYHILEIIGTMFYAISGLLLAKKARFSLTGAFILAMLPGIGGGLIRDIILNRDPVGMLRTPMYFLTVVGTTALFYLFIRARIIFKSLNKISDFFHDIMFVKDFSLVKATDAVGLSVYTIIGVLIAVEVQATPLWLWAPVISVLSSTGGGIIRDFFLGLALNRTFFYETSFVWSLMLTIYIIIRTGSITSTEIFYAILITFWGIILTRIACLKFGIKTRDFWIESFDKD